VNELMTGGAETVTARGWVESRHGFGGRNHGVASKLRKRRTTFEVFAPQPD
jgi:hypothetical protein